jgi:hypothetical protein
MPVILRHRGYRFFFFSNEGEPPEPPHIHVRRGEAVAKFWIFPQVSLEESYGMSPSELRELAGFIENNKEFVRRRWDESFST